VTVNLSKGILLLVTTQINLRSCVRILKLNDNNLTFSLNFKVDLYKKLKFV